MREHWMHSGCHAERSWTRNGVFRGTVASGGSRSSWLTLCEEALSTADAPPFL